MPNDQFHSIFDCFVINLKRHPERLESFLRGNHSSGIKFHRFEAIDGTSSAADGVGSVVAKEARYSAGAIGAAMSHLALWRQCVEKNKAFAVFEDDAVVRCDFKTQLTSLVGQVDDWDFILLGYNTDSVLELNIAPDIDFGGVFSVPYPTAKHLTNFATASGRVSLLRLNLAFGTCGYAIAPAGAEKLERRCFPMDNRPVHGTCTGRTFNAYGIDCRWRPFIEQLPLLFAFRLW